MKEKIVEKELKSKEVTSIEISYYSKDELKKLSNEEEFVTFIIQDSYKTIKSAISDKLEKVELFNILNLSIIVELHSRNFKKVLKRIINHYIACEDYEKCSEIKKLIKKI